MPELGLSKNVSFLVLHPPEFELTIHRVEVIIMHFQYEK